MDTGVVVAGEGRWVGGANPDAHRHRCAPPMRHDGCCDGTGGYTVTEDDVRRSKRPGLPPSMPAGTRTVCISGRPDGGRGAVWICGCGQGWRIGDACDVADYYGEGQHSHGHHAIGGGVCIVGLKWRPLSRWATWRAKRRAR
jgi:hypothetical protein